jgi:hypothetical protein
MRLRWSGEAHHWVGQPGASCVLDWAKHRPGAMSAKQGALKGAGLGVDVGVDVSVEEAGEDAAEDSAEDSAEDVVNEVPTLLDTNGRVLSAKSARSVSRAAGVLGSV